MPSSRQLFSSSVHLLLAVSVVTAHAQTMQTADQDIAKQMANLRSLSDADRPAATVKLAHQIAALPPGPAKVKEADALSNLVTEGDQGAAALQAVADTLSRAIAESPVPADPKSQEPPDPYIGLARLVRYEGATTTLRDPLFLKTLKLFAANDASIEKQDFTLKDISGKPVTLSSLKGKIVMVNFWATWCPPCRIEMPTLEALFTRYESQGLVVLSITDEDLPVLSRFLNEHKYHPTVLLDPGDKVNKQFHVEGIPRTYLLGRDGKLLAVAVDERTARQFQAMLAKTDLHP